MEVCRTPSKRGKYRIEQVGVFGKAGLAYMAVEPEFVEKEMKLFFQDLSEFISTNLDETEVFYFASLIHLRFAHIHPFRDEMVGLPDLLKNGLLLRN